MFRLFRERDGKSGSMGVKAVTVCPLCHPRALVPTFVLEWRKFGAPDRIRTCDLCLRRATLFQLSNGKEFASNRFALLAKILLSSGGAARTGHVLTASKMDSYAF